MVKALTCIHLPGNIFIGITADFNFESMCSPIWLSYHFGKITIRALGIADICWTTIEITRYEQMNGDTWYDDDDERFQRYGHLGRWTLNRSFRLYCVLKSIWIDDKVYTKLSQSDTHTHLHTKISIGHIIWNLTKGKDQNVELCADHTMTWSIRRKLIIDNWSWYSSTNRLINWITHFNMWEQCQYLFRYISTNTNFNDVDVDGNSFGLDVGCLCCTSAWRQQMIPDVCCI